MILQPLARAEFQSVVECSSFVDLLRWRARQEPNRPAYTFLGEGEMEEANLTFAELDQRARAIGACLQDSKAAGERALLLYPPGLDYVAAFSGCLYAGVIAVPAYPPRANRPMPRIHAILEDARASIILTTAHLLSDI